MADYSAYRDLAQEIAGGLIVTSINELVQFTAEAAGLTMLQLLGGTVPSGVPGKGFKSRPSLIKKKSIASYQHNWIKQPPDELDLVQNGAKTVETAIVFSAGTYARGAEGGIYQVEHPTTGAFLEIVQLYEDTGAASTFNVRRNIGGTANAVLPDAAIWRRRDHVVSDRSSQQKVHDIDPTTDNNLTQTIRVDWELSWKGQAMKEYGSLNNPETIKRRKLFAFSKMMNWAFIYGKGGTTTDKNGKRIQFMTGIWDKIVSNVYAPLTANCTGYTAGHGGTLTLEKYRNVFLRRLTRFLPEDVTDVLVLHGDLLERALDFWLEEKIAQKGVDQGTDYLGWECKTIKVGKVRFRHLFDSTIDEGDTGSCTVFPTSALTHCYTNHNGINLDMKHYEIQFQQGQGITSRGGFYLWDGTLEIGWEQGMGKMSGMTDYA
jgi:hypothetical protein